MGRTALFSLTCLGPCVAAAGENSVGAGKTSPEAKGHVPRGLFQAPTAPRREWATTNSSSSPPPPPGLSGDHNSGPSASLSGPGGRLGASLRAHPPSPHNASLSKERKYSRSVVSDPLRRHGLHSACNSPGQNIRAGNCPSSRGSSPLGTEPHSV